MRIKSATKKLIAEWKAIHDNNVDIDSYADKGGAHWESLCVGWCLAKGFTTEEAYAFYREMIPLELF